MHDEDEKFNAFIREEASGYNAPLAPPSDRMWSRIEGDIAVAIGTARPRRSPWLAIGVGIAAVLVAGVSLGRWSAGTRTAPVGVTVASLTPAADDSMRAVSHARASTVEHLAQTEVFLTTVRADLKAGRPDAERTARSRELLARTRLMLGAAGYRSPEERQLLEDIELLLAEISAMPSARSRPSMDTQLLDESMRDGNILPRLRTTMPAHAAGT